MINFGRQYGSKKSLFKLGAMLVVVIIACCIVWSITKKHYEDHPIILNNSETTVTPVIENVIEKEVTVSSETIGEGFRDIGTLNTSEYYFTHVSRYAESATLYGYEIPFSESSYIYSYDGKVTAGMDFAAIEVEVDDDERVITLTLPPVDITGFEIDTDSFKLYDETMSVLNPISMGTMGDTMARMEEDEKQKAINKGLLSNAEDNAVLLVENFMNGLYEANGYTVNIVVTDSNSAK